MMTGVYRNSASGLILSLLLLTKANAETSSTNEFDSGMLILLPNQPTIDIRRFNQSGAISAGTYLLDVYVNDKWRGRTDVTYMDDKEQLHQSAKLCIQDELLKKLDINPDISQEISAHKNPNGCYDVTAVIKDMKTEVDMSSMRLDISIPQIYLIERPDDYIDPSSWDKGVNSAFASYQFNHHRNDQSTQSHATYLGLNTGVNVNGWYFRHQGSVRANDDQTPHYQAINTYINTALPQLQSQLTLGDFYSDSTLFEGNSMRGIQIASDNRMLPGSLQGYAPTIQGIANSNAKVSIFQNNQEIYNTTVPAGAFLLDNVRNIGGNGDLTVVITEADGREIRQIVPYHGAISLLRPRRSRYAYALGRIRYDNTHLYNDYIFQGIWQQGLTNRWTANAGVLYSRNYHSISLGSAFNTKLGAFSVNAIGTQHSFDNQPVQNGYQLRLQYHHFIPKTKTNLQASAWYYNKYRSLEESLRLQENKNNNNQFSNPKFRYQLSINQPLGDTFGSLYAFFSRTTDHNNQHQDQWQVGYSNKIGMLSYGLSAQGTKLDKGTWDKQYMLNASLPFGKAGRHHLNNFYSKAGSSAHLQTGLAGTFEKLPHFDYGLNIAHQKDTQQNHKQTSWSANANYQLPLVKLSSTYSQSDNARQYSFGASGGIVVHKGGVTGSNHLGDTFAIVHLPNGKGASLDNSKNVVFNKKGYAILPNLSPYRINTLTINPEGLPYDVQLEETGGQVAPIANSSVLIKFNSSVGKMALLNVKLADGTYPPMGTSVYDTKMTEVGFVGQDGRVFLQNAQEEDTLILHINDKKCQLTYQLPESTPTTTPIRIVNAVCQ